MISFIGTYYLKSTEIYNSDTKTFSSHLDLPVATDDHTIVKIDQNKYFICCGVFMSGKSFIFDDEGWRETPKSSDDHYLGFAGN